jgi:hypothetical protein
MTFHFAFTGKQVQEVLDIPINNTYICIYITVSEREDTCHDVDSVRKEYASAVITSLHTNEASTESDLARFDGCV